MSSVPLPSGGVQIAETRRHPTRFPSRLNPRPSFSPTFLPFLSPPHHQYTHNAIAQRNSSSYPELSPSRRNPRRGPRRGQQSSSSNFKLQLELHTPQYHPWPPVHLRVRLHTSQGPGVLEIRRAKGCPQVSCEPHTLPPACAMPSRRKLTSNHLPTIAYTNTPSPHPTAPR